MQMHSGYAISMLTLQKDAEKGLESLTAKMKASKHSAEQIHALFKERAAIEEEYSRRLTKMAKTFSPREETGTLREALDVLRTELERSAKVHSDIANDMRFNLEKTLGDFIASQQVARRQNLAPAEKLQKMKQSQLALANKIKDKLTAKRQDMDTSAKLSLGNMLDKKSRQEKNQQQLQQYEEDLKCALVKLSETHEKWLVEMRKSSEACQRLEEERLTFLKAALWDYSNLVATLCVTDDQCCESIRQALEDVNIDKDIQLAIEIFSGGKMTAELTPLSKANSEQLALDIHIPDGDLKSSVANLFEKYGIEGNSKESASSPFGSTDDIFKKVVSPTENRISDMKRPSPPEIKVQEPTPQTASPTNIPSPEEETQLETYDPYQIPENLTTICTVKVLYNYKSQAPEELTLEKGSLIPVFAKHEDEWWEGISVENGKKRKGIFPSNFVSVVKN